MTAHPAGTVRNALKGAAEAALALSGLPWIARRRLSSRTLILAYHNVVPDEEAGIGDSSLHLPLSAFRKHLDAIQKHCDCVGLGDLLHQNPTDGRPRVIVTFDDAYRGAVKLATPELASRGMPATVCVCPGRLDGHEFWWDRFASQASRIASDFRDAALWQHRGEDEQVTEWAGRRGIPGDSLPWHMASASAAELHEMLDLPGLTVGSHTWSHANLASLEEAEIREETGRSYSWLEKEFGKGFVPYLAYPYGLSNATARGVVSEVGYAGGLEVVGGWFSPPDTHPSRLPRLDVSAGLSIRGFSLRLAGLLQR